LIDDVCKRLTAMADDPPFRFVDTPERDADAYLKRLKTFAGYSEPEVARAELRLGLVFPTVFRTFLLFMGRDRGELLAGSDLARVEDFEKFRANAIGPQGHALRPGHVPRL